MRRPDDGISDKVRLPRLFCMRSHQGFQIFNTVTLGSSVGTNSFNTMKKNRKNEELQSRREFFKKAAKGALPILGAIAVAGIPLLAKAKGEVPSGCNYSCSGSCYGGCSGSCVYGCTGGCRNGCKGCKNSCISDCEATCALTCSNSCYTGCVRALR